MPLLDHLKKSISLFIHVSKVLLLLCFICCCLVIDKLISLTSTQDRIIFLDTIDMDILVAICRYDVDDVQDLPLFAYSL